MEVNLKIFDMSSLTTNFCAHIIGPSGCGKSVLLDEILFTYYKTFDIIIGISPTETSLNKLRKYTLGNSLHKTYEAKKINSIINQFIEDVETMLVINESRKFLILFDECDILGNLMKSNETMRKLYMLSKRLNISIINITQQCEDIGTSIQDQITHVFAFEQCNNKSIIKLHKNLFGIIDDIKLFIEVCKGYTGNHGCLVLIPNSPSSYFSDKLRWYRSSLDRSCNRIETKNPNELANSFKDQMKQKCTNCGQETLIVSKME